MHNTHLKMICLLVNYFCYRQHNKDISKTADVGFCCR